MSGLDGLQLGADGYLDMDQFPDDGTDLAGAELDQLREVLRADPVDEPTPEQWDAMFDDVVGTDDAGPFALDDVDGLDPAADLFPSDDPVASDAEPDADLDPTDGDDPDAADDLALEDVTAEDLDLDLGPDLDLEVDLAVDDAFTPDSAEDGPADVSSDFEDLL